MIPNPGWGEFIVIILFFFITGWLSGQSKGRQYKKQPQHYYLSSLKKFLVIPCVFTVTSLMLRVILMEPPEPELLIAIPIIFCFFIAILWLPNAIGQHLGYQSTGFIYQEHGEQCSKCGYPIGHLNHRQCPECGYINEKASNYNSSNHASNNHKSNNDKSANKSCTDQV